MEQYYDFSAEEDGEDDILNRAFDRWEEQLGGGTANNGPLFKFKMVPIGRRRTWREVVRRDQFKAELQQLREPIPNDNIG